MPYNVTVNQDHTMIGDTEYDEGAELVLDDATYSSLLAAGRFDDDTLTDGGPVPVGDDEIYDQGTNVAALGALTAANPAAVTAAQPAAMTASAALTGGEPPTEVEFNALRADVVAVRAEVVKLVTDLTATRAEVVKLVTDLGTSRTKVNALLTALTGTGKPLET